MSASETPSLQDRLRRVGAQATDAETAVTIDAVIRHLDELEQRVSELTEIKTGYYQAMLAWRFRAEHGTPLEKTLTSLRGGTPGRLPCPAHLGPMA